MPLIREVWWVCCGEGGGDGSSTWRWPTPDVGPGLGEAANANRRTRAGAADQRVSFARKGPCWMRGKVLSADCLWQSWSANNEECNWPAGHTVPLDELQQQLFQLHNLFSCTLFRLPYQFCVLFTFVFVLSPALPRSNPLRCLVSPAVTAHPASSSFFQAAADVGWRWCHRIT